MLPHLFLIFIFLNLLDLITTFYALRNGAIETNAIMRFMFSCGLWSATLIKVLGVSAIFILAQKISKINWRIAFYLLLFLDIIFTLIVINNIYWCYQ